MKKLFPRPLLAVVLTVFWAILQNSFMPGTLMMGFAVASLILYVVDPILLPKIEHWHPWKLAKFFLKVLGVVIVSNFHIARLYLGPVKRLRPAFVEVPIDLEHDVAISILVSIVSMTPGTIAADLSEDKNTLLVHGIHMKDPQDVIKEIKEHYEAPLKEIYPC